MAGQRPLLLQNLLAASRHPRNSLSSCCCSLLIPVNVLELSDASFSESKPLSKLQNHHDPLLMLWLRFLSFISVDSRIMGVQQLEDNLSIIHAHLYAWLNILGLEANNKEGTT